MSSEDTPSVIRGQAPDDSTRARTLVHAIYSAQLAAACERLGVSVEALLEGTDVTPAMLEQPDGRLTLPQAEQIAKNAVERTGEPGLAFHYGLQLKLSSHGSVGLLAMSSATLAEALSVVDRFSRLRAPDVRFLHSFVGEHVALELLPDSPDPLVRRFLTEALITAFAQMLRALLGRPFTARFEVRHAEPAYFARFRHLWPGPVTFGAAHDRALMPRGYLDEPLQMADSVAARHMTRECEAELARLGEPASASAAVRRVLREGTGVPTLQEMAAQRGVSERTLKRHLHAEGTTYRALVEEARQVRAMDLLSNSSLSVAAVAKQLGYADTANFHRAFRRWYGTTPDALRRTEPAGRGAGDSDA